MYDHCESCCYCYCCCCCCCFGCCCCSCCCLVIVVVTQVKVLCLSHTRLFSIQQVKVVSCSIGWQGFASARLLHFREALFGEVHRRGGSEDALVPQGGGGFLRRCRWTPSWRGGFLPDLWHFSRRGGHGQGGGRKVQGDREEVKREERRFFHIFSVAVGVANCCHYGCSWSYWV